MVLFFFFQAEDGIRDYKVTGVQTCALPIWHGRSAGTRESGHAHHGYGGLRCGCFGEVYLELDDGSEVLLRAGDCVVQNGTRHAWRNRSPANCVIAVTLVGAERGK